MIRTFARSRAFPFLAWAYVVALGVQVFFAGMFVFVGASNIELHRNMAHVIGLLTGLLILSTFVGRVPDAVAFVLSGRTVPLISRAGTGVQLKTIETFELGLPAVASMSANLTISPDGNFLYYAYGGLGIQNR